MGFEGIGASVRRKEDVRFLSGRGNYTDDINRPGQLYAYIKRSDRPHARLNGLDVSAAQAAPGVVAVFVGADMAADNVGGLPCGWQIHSKDGSPMAEPPHPVLAIGKVRHVGDPVAVVIAESRQAAKDAAELIHPDYEDLPASATTTAALKPGAATVHDDVAGNVCYDWHIGDKAVVDDVFAKAHKVVRLDLENNRLIPNAMEPRSALGDFDTSSGDYTLFTTSQNPHVIRLLMGAFVLHIPENKLRVVAPDVGGGFGSKIYHYAEEAIVTWASAKVRRPVKWTAERNESFMSDAHGRDHVTKIELACEKDGTFIAFRTETMANVGAYLSNFSTVTPTFLHGTLMAGPYKVPNVYVNVKTVFTNTAPVDAYRGAGRPEATYSLERVVDQMCRELGLDPFEVRRKNFITTDMFPYTTPAGLAYDVGNYHATLDKAIELADVAGFEKRRAASAAKGKLRGLGLSTWIEACGIAPSNLVGILGARVGLYDAATVRVNPTGNVSVMVGAHSHGQSHETVFAQIISDMFGIPMSSVDIVHGDTAKIPFGMGSYGSRSLAVCGQAMANAADKVIAKGKKIAAHMLEAAEAEIVFSDGVFAVSGTNRSKTFGEIAFSAYVPHNYPLATLEPGLEETAFYDPANFTYPAGTYLCEVEVDADTGKVDVCNFTCADDFGNVMNPMVVRGQVHGGVVQGIGQALLEHGVYDENGQLLSGSYMDYTMPRADDVPFVTVDHSCVTPCSHNKLGVKGCGEAGAIGSPPAVVNAVLDALNRAGHKIAHIDMPLTPSRVWSAMNA